MDNNILFFPSSRLCNYSLRGFSSLILLILVSSLVIVNLFTPLQPLNFLHLTFFSYSSSYSSSSYSSSSSSLLSDECDYSDGEWVRDESYGDGYYSEDCPFIDPGFQCNKNGRNNTDYRNWRWQPRGCDLPRFSASEMLERSRNRRVVFVGDSIGRNQWESLVCMLSAAVTNKSGIYETNGNPITKHKGFLSIKFNHYNLTVEYYRAPFLVVIGRPPPNSSLIVKKAIKVKTPEWSSKLWDGADVLVLNSGHWWNLDKTIKQGIYFQVTETLNMTMDVVVAFQKALETIGAWGSTHLQSNKSFLFFRSFSPPHWSGAWNRGGGCDMWTEPENNHTKLSSDFWYNKVMQETINGMQSKGMRAHLLNISYLTKFRGDGHPSKHREIGTPANARQDCSHWCLPGVPDVWNEILYARLLHNNYGSSASTSI